MDVNGKYFRKFVERNEKYYIEQNEKAIKKQHSKGKLTARERINLLFDEGTFEEIDAFVKPSSISFGKVGDEYGDGVIIGYGKISSRLAYVYAQDFSVMGGSLGAVHAEKIVKVQELALRTGAPII